MFSFESITLGLFVLERVCVRLQVFSLFLSFICSSACVPTLSGDYTLL